MKNQKSEFDNSKLRARILADYGTIKRFAAVVDMNPCSLYRRLQGRADFCLSEIVRIVGALRLNKEETNLYFFNT